MFGRLKKRLSNRVPVPANGASVPYNAGSAPPAYSDSVPFSPDSFSAAGPSSSGKYDYVAPVGAPPAAAPGPYAPVSIPSNDDDPYAFLSTFDTIFLVDDSGSMYGSNWTQTRDVLSAIVPICAARDPDGVDLYFLNHKAPGSNDGTKGPGGYYGINSPSTLIDIFNRVNPRGTTPTGTRLRSILKPYTDVLDKAHRNGTLDSVRPLNIIIVTDGQPTDDVEGVVVQTARKLDSLEAASYQVGLQFFQVGDSPKAARALQDLDDGLEETKGIRDIVDTVPGGILTTEVIMKTVLGAVNRRLDRKAVAGAKS